MNYKNTKDKMRWIGQLSRYVIGAILVYSSIGKILHPFDFLSVIYEYKMMKFGEGVFFALIIPWLELVSGVCLIAGIALKGALSVSSVLFLLFAFAQGSALSRGLDISCGCFSVSSVIESGFVSYYTLLRTIGLFGASIYSFLCMNGEK